MAWVWLLLAVVRLTTSLSAAPPPFQPLVDAAALGDASNVDRMLQDSPSPFLKGVALVSAATHGHLDLVSALLEAEDMPRESKGKALVAASAGGFSAIVRVLLRHDITIEYIGNALQSAAEFSHTSLAFELLEYPVHMFKKGGALSWAVRTGNTELMEVLLTRHEGILPQDIGSALRWAVESNRVDLVHMLVRTNRLQPLDIGRNLVHAARLGFTGSLELLMQYPYSAMHLQDALRAATVANHCTCIKILVTSALASTEVRQPALAVALRSQFYDIAVALVTEQEINTPLDRNGNPILHLVACAGDMRLIDQLLSSGADHQLVNGRGLYFHEYARECGQQEVFNSFRAMMTNSMDMYRWVGDLNHNVLDFVAGDNPLTRASAASAAHYYSRSQAGIHRPHRYG